MSSFIFKYRDSVASYLLNWMPSPFSRYCKFPNLEKPKWLNFFKVDPNGETQSKITRFMSGLIPFADLARSDIRTKNTPAGFEILKTEPLIFKHEDLSESVLKACSWWPSPQMIPKKFGIDFCQFPMSNSERIPMNFVLKNVIRQHHLDKLYTPEKKLAQLPTDTWSYPELEKSFKTFDAAQRDFKDAIKTLDHQHLVIAEKLDLTSKQETEEIISRMPLAVQKQYVQQLFTLAFYSGYSDMHLWNLSFIKSGPHKDEIAIFDTETHGLSYYHARMSKQSKKLGYLRDIELNYALLAVRQAIDPKEGLPFDKRVLKEVADQFTQRIEKELLYNKACRTLIPTAAAASLCVLGILAYQY